MRAALVPLAAAAPLGQVSGAGYQVSGEAWEAAGGRDIAVPLELFAQSPLAPDTRHLAPPLLQVFDSYILFQTGDGVAIVDQHSAHERVLYEDVMRQLTGDGASAQRLLLPLTLDFTPVELEAIEAHRELLRRVGFEIEPFAGRSVIVHHLDPQEMRELVLRLLTASLPAHDVHGRPTIVQLPKDELERRFGRT